MISAKLGRFAHKAKWSNREYDPDQPTYELFKVNRRQHDKWEHPDHLRWYTVFPYGNWPQDRKKGRLWRIYLYEKEPTL